MRRRPGGMGSVHLSLLRLTQPAQFVRGQFRLAKPQMLCLFRRAAALRERFGRRVLGPTAPPVDRVRGEYLATLLLKVEAGASLARAREAVRGILDRVVKSPECKGVTILCDVDPQ